MPLQGSSLGRIKPFEPRSFKSKTSAPATPTVPWVPMTPTSPVPVTPTTLASPSTPTGGSLCRHRQHGKRRPWARSNLDAWLEKAFSPRHHTQEEDDRRSRRRSRSHQRSHKANLLHRTLTGLSFSRAATRRRRRRERKGAKNNGDGTQWSDYASELEQYFAEAEANLCDDQQDDVQLEDSDSDSDSESDSDWATPRKAEIIDSDDKEIEEPRETEEVDPEGLNASTVERVLPPVDVPFRYRAQDRQGGVLVAGDRVLFTNRAFKRQLRRLGELGPIPERSSSENPAQPVPYEMEFLSERYSGQIVEL